MKLLSVEAPEESLARFLTERGVQTTSGRSAVWQATQQLDQVDTLLAEAGTSKEKILQITIWLADMADFAEMNAV